MKLRFPSYETSFLCDCTLQEATERIAKAAASEANDLTVKKACYDGKQKIVLYSGMWLGFYTNCFAPVASLEIKKAEQGVSVSVNFSLRKPIKLITFAYCALTFLLGVIALAANLLSEQTLTLLYCIPFVAAVFGYVLGWGGLYFSAGRMLEVLHYSLTLEFAKRLPALHSC